jgi:hypothetical protein
MFPRRLIMRQLLLVGIVCATVGIAAVGDQNQQTQPAPGADPYLNNAAAGTTAFPLAAPAGQVAIASIVLA